MSTPTQATDFSQSLRANGSAGAGTLVISLDLELYWGVRDKRQLNDYRENLLGVRGAVDRMLGSFETYRVHATWATVGFLFFRNLAELKRNYPSRLPAYANAVLSPYAYADALSEVDETCHFAPDIIDRIRSHPGQEIGTHTFSHYYCLERGQDAVSFREDLASALRVAGERGVRLESMVFPRNQWNGAYLPVLAEMGIRCYRGNEPSAAYGAASSNEQSAVRRAIRLLDSYINLTGHHTYSREECMRSVPYSIPSSRLLRPVSARLAAFEGLRLKRIADAMEHAARHGRIFHLWWHPHNFGKDTDRNIAFLERVLDRFDFLRDRYGMTSMSMGELAQTFEVANAA